MIVKFYKFSLDCNKKEEKRQSKQCIDYIDKVINGSEVIS